MNLRVFLRNEWSIYIRNKMIKDKCEMCGTDLNLHLHHIEKFDSLLIETLKELNLKELDTEQYKEYELNLISNIMLGKQVKCKYQTLCESCHIEEHKKEKVRKEEERKLYVENILEPYLNNIVDKKLLKEDKERLIIKINSKVNGRLQKTYNKLNEELQNYNLKYKIITKRTNKERYWVIIRT